MNVEHQLKGTTDGTEVLLIRDMKEVDKYLNMWYTAQRTHTPSMQKLLSHLGNLEPKMFLSGWSP